MPLARMALRPFFALICFTSEIAGWLWCTFLYFKFFFPTTFCASGKKKEKGGSVHRRHACPSSESDEPFCWLAEIYIHMHIPDRFHVSMCTDVGYFFPSLYLPHASRLSCSFHFLEALVHHRRLQDMTITVHVSLLQPWIYLPDGNVRSLHVLHFIYLFL
uniref:Putative secreted protein n=1 Tax=Amblyomma triste TaxID=251400 RepID=A0A023G2U2_AMBTT